MELYKMLKTIFTYFNVLIIRNNLDFNTKHN